MLPKERTKHVDTCQLDHGLGSRASRFQHHAPVLGYLLHVHRNFVVFGAPWATLDVYSKTLARQNRVLRVLGLFRDITEKGRMRARREKSRHPLYSATELSHGRSLLATILSTPDPFPAGYFSFDAQRDFGVSRPQGGLV